MKSKLCSVLLLAFILTACGEGKEEALDKEIHALKLVIDQDNISEKNFQEIKQKIDKLADEASHKPRYWVQKARFELVCGYFSLQCKVERRWDKALKAIEQAKKLGPNDVEVLSLSGHILRNINDHESAREDLEKALSINNKHAWANLNYGALMADIGMKMPFKLEDEAYMDRRRNIFKKSLAAFKVVLDGDYRNREKKAALAKCDDVAVWVHHEERLYCHKKAIELDYFDNLKEKAWARGNYALQLLKAEKYSEAKKYAEEALQLMKYPMARKMLAASYLGLWKQSGYKDDSHFHQAFKVYSRNKLDPVFALSQLTLMSDIPFYKKLQEKGIDLNQLDSKGMTLLGRALVFYINDKEKNFDRIKSFVEQLDLKIDQPYVSRPNQEPVYTTPIQAVRERLEKLKERSKKEYFNDHVALKVYTKLYEYFQQRLKKRTIEEQTSGDTTI